MRVKLTARKNLEVQGVRKTYPAGQIIDIGKGSAREWIARGEAVAVGVKKKVIRIPPMRDEHPSAAIHDFRNYWYSGNGGNYSIASPNIVCSYSRAWERGGPDPIFNGCKICQNAEWASRLTGCDAFPSGHTCSTSEFAREHCIHQGEDYPHLGQNYLFAAFTDDETPAPKCLMAHSIKGVKHLWSYSADQGRIAWARQFAIACQYDLFGVGVEVQPKEAECYDFIFTYCTGSNYNPFPRSDTVPLLMYGHDLWKGRENRQAMIDDLEPDIFWTPYPSSWKAHYSFSKKTQIVFRPIPAGTFLTRPNLDEEKKKFDLLVIGATGNLIYQPRKDLTDQILKIAKKPFRIHIHNSAGASRSRHTGSIRAGSRPFITAWSEFLGSSRYVIFDGIAEEPQPIFFKYYETLGSGAVPIFPNAPDLALLGIKPWKHFIPVEEYRNNNEGLLKLLGEDHSDIARNAVAWYFENADTMLYDWLEDMIHEMIEDNPYQKRRRP